VTGRQSVLPPSVAPNSSRPRATILPGIETTPRPSRNQGHFQTCSATFPTPTGLGECCPGKREEGGLLCGEDIVRGNGMAELRMRMSTTDFAGLILRTRVSHRFHARQRPADVRGSKSPFRSFTCDGGSDASVSEVTVTQTVNSKFANWRNTGPARFNSIDKYSTLRRNSTIDCLQDSLCTRGRRSSPLQESNAEPAGDASSFGSHKSQILRGSTKSITSTPGFRSPWMRP
jgi:hypothetical protein